MKKAKLIPTILLALLALPAALAQVAITEVMYAPNQTASETDSEWIELYNSGTTEANLTGWAIDGSVFSPAILGAKQYIVAARELVDGTDADTDSFQSVWGTAINAVEGSFTLSNTGDTVTLTDSAGNTVDSVTYTPDTGGNKNGKTIELVNGVWTESLAYGGTPGTGPAANTTGGLSDEIPVTLSVDNSPPEIQSASYDATKIYATVHDANGPDDITQVYAKLLDQVINMALEAATYKADMPNLYPGNYQATVYASDAASTSNKTITITIDTIAAMNFVQEAITFTNMKAGETKNTTLEIQNNGNVDLQLDFAVVGDTVLQDNLECYDTAWKKISTCTTTVKAGEKASINMRAAVPEGTKAGTYTGKLQTTATVL